MPYILNKTNGSVIATVADGSINQTTDLTFVGKNYAGYGEFVNENLLKLLENFSNKTQPPKAITGQLWYDSANKKLKVYDGSSFVSLAYTSYSSNGSSPKNLGTGDLWFDQSQNVLNVYTGTKWLPVGPAASASGTGASSVIPVLSTSVKDIDGGSHSIATHVVSDQQGVLRTVAVMSYDLSFELDHQNSLYTSGDFTNKIRRGITLAGANSSGRSATSLSDAGGNFLWGTASDALQLQGHDASYFLPAADYQNGVLYGLEIQNDEGVVVGQAGTKIFKFHSNQGNSEGKLSVINGDKMSFNLRYPTLTSTLTNVLNIVGNKLLPGYNTPTDIGAVGNRFANIYANTMTATTINAGVINGSVANFTTINAIVSGTLSGNAATASRLALPVLINGVPFDGSADLPNVPTANALTAGSYLTSNGTFNGTFPRLFAVDATTTPTGSKVVARDSGGNVYANIFYGRIAATTVTGNLSVLGTITATASITAYADVAERYAADAVYDFGTVLVIGGDKEVTVTTERASTAVAGIVSQKPAYMLNSDAGTDETHPYIALKGRVLCKVTGSVKKGELLVTSNMAGVACAWQPGDDANAVIGKALESSEGPAGIIEVKV